MTRASTYRLTHSTLWISLTILIASRAPLQAHGSTFSRYGYRAAGGALDALTTDLIPLLQKTEPETSPRRSPGKRKNLEEESSSYSESESSTSATESESSTSATDVQSDVVNSEGKVKFTVNGKKVAELCEGTLMKGSLLKLASDILRGAAALDADKKNQFESFLICPLRDLDSDTKKVVKCQLGPDYFIGKSLKYVLENMLHLVTKVDGTGANSIVLHMGSDVVDAGVTLGLPRNPAKYLTLVQPYLGNYNNNNYFTYTTDNRKWYNERRVHFATSGATRVKVESSPNLLKYCSGYAEFKNFGEIFMELQLDENVQWTDLSTASESISTLNNVKVKVLFQGGLQGAYFYIKVHDLEELPDSAGLTPFIFVGDQNDKVEAFSQTVHRIVQIKLSEKEYAYPAAREFLKFYVRQIPHWRALGHYLKELTPVASHIEEYIYEVDDFSLSFSSTSKDWSRGISVPVYWGNPSTEKALRVCTIHWLTDIQITKMTKALTEGLSFEEFRKVLGTPQDLGPLFARDFETRGSGPMPGPMVICGTHWTWKRQMRFSISLADAKVLFDSRPKYNVEEKAFYIKENPIGVLGVDYFKDKTSKNWKNFFEKCAEKMHKGAQTGKKSLTTGLSKESSGKYRQGDKLFGKLRKQFSPKIISQFNRKSTLPAQRYSSKAHH